ncbi:MFS transporter [soil metagenome]
MQSMKAVSLWRLPAMRQLWTLSLLGFSSFSLTLAALPSYAVSVGVSTATAGLVTAVMLGTTVLTQAAVPALTARLGVARVFAVGLLLLGAPAPLYLVSTELWWLLLVSAVRGCGFAVLTVLGATMAARLAPAARQGESIGIYGLSVALPGLLLVPGGVALTLGGRFGWVAVLAAVPVLAVPMALTLGRADPADSTTGRGGGSRAAVRAALGPSAILVLVTLAGGGVVTFLPIERPEGALAATALLATGITAAASRWAAGVLVDRIGSRVLLPAALLASIGGLLLIALGLTQGTGGGAAVRIVTGAAIFGVGYGAVQNLTLVLAFARAGPDRTNTASAVWNASFDIGTAIGAVAVGAAAATGLGLPLSYLACAVAITATVPLALAVTRRR